MAPNQRHAMLERAIRAGRSAVREIAGDDAQDANEKEPKPSEPTPSSSPQLPGDRGLGEAVKRTRATARWIVVAFGAIGAVIIGTAPLNDVGSVDALDLRSVAAAAGLLAAVLAVVIVIWQAARVDEPIGISPAELVHAEARVPRSRWPPTLGDPDEIGAAADWLYDADLIDVPVPYDERSRRIAWIVRERDRRRDEYLESLEDVDAANTREARARREQRAKGPHAAFLRVEGELGRLADLANYHRLSARYRRAKHSIAVAAPVAAFGMVLFVWGTHPPKETPAGVRLEGIRLTHAVGVDLQNARLAGANLAGASLMRSDLSGASLVAADLQGANLMGTKLHGADLSAANLRNASQCFLARRRKPRPGGACVL